MLRRTTMGPTYTEIIGDQTLGLAGSLDRLLTPLPPPAPPLVFRPEGEPDVPVGQTWVNKPHPADNGTYRSFSMIAWFFQWLSNSESNLQAQMTIFWLNHFGLADVHDHRSNYRYIQLMQTHGLGNIRDMIKRVTVSPAMLEFQNGDTNSAENPNENYARELLELFTIQKGEQIGQGDYSNYTEQDVVSVARALTGWRNFDFSFSRDDTPVDSYFDQEEHDQGTKQLSYHFSNRVIQPAGKDEFRNVIDIIFEQEETARAFCRKLYRFFVNSEINKSIEREIIAPLTNTLIASDFEVIPVLRQLFSSTHFYDLRYTAAKIKNPYDFVVGVHRPLNSPAHIDFPDLQTEYEVYYQQHKFAEDMGMEFYKLPTVAGWDAYYRSPSFYRNWVSPATIQYRNKMVKIVVNTFYYTNGFRTKLDIRSFLTTLSDPSNIEAVIIDSALIFLPREITAPQIVALKGHLLGEELDDAEWTVEYQTYVDRSVDERFEFSFEKRVYEFLRSLLTMLEFQLQ